MFKPCQKFCTDECKKAWQFFREIGAQVWVFLGFCAIVMFTFLEPDLSNFSVIPVDRPDFVFESVTFSHIQDGNLTWSFSAQSAAIDKVAKIAQIKNVNGEFFQAERSILKVKSPSGRLNMETSKMLLETAELYYTVKENPVTLNATELRWDPDTRRFEGRGDVAVLSGHVKLTGEYFLVDVANQKLIMSENSRASIQETP